MPPKSRVKKVTIRSTFLDSLDSNLSSSSTSADLSQPNILSAYGLLSPSSSCAPKWTGTETPEVERTPKALQIALIEKRNGKGKGKQVDMVDLTAETTEEEGEDEDPIRDGDNDGDYDDPPKRMGSGSTKKATKTYGGKGKGTGTSLSLSVNGKGKAMESCSEANCGGNPLCLNWMGQDKWEDTKKAFKAYRKARGVDEDPSNERDPDLPVGLTNLGATCYANSLLQTWYQDVTFREGVYACLPPDNGKVDETPLFQLQVLFCFLQKSGQGTYNPKPLIDSLKINDQMQQDASEFHKLFLEVLDAQFKKSGKKKREEGLDEGWEAGGANGKLGKKRVNVETLVEDQFEGMITYGTECLTCRKKSERQMPFRELEVSLKPNCDLEARIKEAHKDESMTGDNQYECGHCKRKRDARRYTVLQQLPPVLHFSVLRFVYSQEKEDRVKCTHAISYPLKLNMGQFVEGGKKQDIWYDLKGVLLHKGTSAHHGHYMAQVFDTSKQKWFLMNDDDISPIDDLNESEKVDSSGSGSDSKDNKSKGKTTKAGFTTNSSGDVIPKSKDAYMLIYTRRTDSSPAVPIEPTPPPLAEMRVEELDMEHEKLIEGYKSQEKLVKDDFEKALEEKRSVYRVWEATDLQEEDALIVDKKALKIWVESGLVVQKGKRKAKEASTAPPDKSKERIEGTPTDPPAEIDMTLGSKAPAAPSVVDDSVVAETPPPPAIDTDTEMEDATAEPPGSPTPTLKADDSPIAEADGEDPLGDPSRIMDNGRILCKHDKVDPDKAEHVKLISQLGAMALKELGVIMVPELLVSTSLCRECCFDVASEHLYKKDHAEHLAQFDECSRGGEGSWVSSAWLKDWRLEIPKHIHTSDADPFADQHPGDDPWTEHVVCRHGALYPDPKKRTKLSDEETALFRSIFPAWVPATYDSDDCGLCAGDLEQAKKDKDNLAIIRGQQKNQLGSLMSAAQTRLDGRLTLAASISFVVPQVWARTWLKFAGAKKSEAAPQPGALDNAEFICVHGRTSLDLEDQSALQKMIMTVEGREWHFLQTNYNAGPPIKITRDGSSLELRTTPASCAQCVNARRQEFSSTTLKIKMMTADDFNADGTLKSEDDDVRLSPVEATSSNPSEPKLINGGGTRTSNRIRTKVGAPKALKLKEIEMFKTDTVKDLKIRIQEAHNIPTIYQRLFFNKQELESHQTVEAVGLQVGSILGLKSFDGDDGSVDLSKLTDDVTIDRKKRKGRQEGFGGTGLSGWQEEATSEDVHPVASTSVTSPKTNGRKRKSPSPPPPPRATKASKVEVDLDPIIVSCASCTFQAELAEFCPVCEQPQLN